MVALMHYVNYYAVQKNMGSLAGKPSQQITFLWYSVTKRMSDRFIVNYTERELLWTTVRFQRVIGFF